MAKDDSEKILELFAKKNLPSILGSENFITWVKETFFDRKKHHQVPESSQLAPELSEIKNAVCRFYSIEEKEILLTRRGALNEPRNVAIYLSRLLRRDSLLKISENFNMAGYSSASSAIERVQKKLAKDKKFKKRIDTIKLSIFSK